MIHLLQFLDQAEWLDTLERDFIAAAETAISNRGIFHVALSGGSTPKPWYQRLNQISLPWSKIEWWIGDERWVPPTDSSSNEKMIRETLGKDLPEFESHFHSWHLAKEVSEAALLYDKKLKQKLGEKVVFDLVFLGIGPDGHTASLFPHTVALKEKKRFAVENPVPQLNTTRLTFTFPVLEKARAIAFLVQGKEKKEMIEKVIAPNSEFPAGSIHSQNQKLYWLVS